MKLKLWLSAKDLGDGSFSIQLDNTKVEALEYLERTEEEIHDGCFYDDGMFKEIELEIDENGKLLKPFYINIDG